MLETVLISLAKENFHMGKKNLRPKPIIETYLGLTQSYQSETKNGSVTVHYRAAEPPEPSLRAFLHSILPEKIPNKSNRASTSFDNRIYYAISTREVLSLTPELKAKAIVLARERNIILRTMTWNAIRVPTIYELIAVQESSYSPLRQELSFTIQIEPIEDVRKVLLYCGRERSKL